MGAPGTREGVKFEGRKSTCHDLLGFCCVSFWCFRTAVPPVGIDTDFIATGTTEEIIHWHVTTFASNVPKGLFDTTDRTIQIHCPTLASKIVVRHVSKMLDVHRRTFDQVASQLAHMCDNALIAVSLRVTLAPATDAITSIDFDKKPVFSCTWID